MARVPDVLAPFTAAIEKFSKRDATSVVIALCLVFALISFGIGATIAGRLSWVIVLTGVVSFLTGIGAFLYALISKPDRLRSEETVRMGMLLDWIQRPDVDDDRRSSAAALLPLLLDIKSSRRSAITTASREERND